jgi:DNA repair exonuclease SbcCD ATPase subunit
VTDQYYSQEENITETPDTALDNWQAQSNAVANFVPEAAQELERASQALTKLWESAGAQGNTGDQALIQHLWDIEQRQAGRVVQLDAARQAAITVVQQLDQQLNKAEYDLKEINRAIETIDEDHPAIAELVEQVQQDTMDWAEDMAEQNTTEYAFDTAWEEVHDRVQHVTGLSWGKAYRFVSYLRGYREITDEQKALLITMIESLNAEMDEFYMPHEGEEDEADE